MNTVRDLNFRFQFPYNTRHSGDRNSSDICHIRDTEFVTENNTVDPAVLQSVQIFSRSFKDCINAALCNIPMIGFSQPNTSLIHSFVIFFLLLYDFNVRLVSSFLKVQFLTIGMKFFVRYFQNACINLLFLRTVHPYIMMLSNEQANFRNTQEND